MKKSILLFYLMLFTGATLFAQVEHSVPFPTTFPTYPYSSPQDNFKATKIVEARKGTDGIWYCLVKLEAFAIKKQPPGIKYFEPPAFSNQVYFANNNGSYTYSRPLNGGYSPNIPGQNEVSLYKSYKQYMPTGENGYFVWLKANYATDTQIGIIPDPGIHSIPLPNVIGGSMFNIIYSIGYSYKSGFPSNIRFGGWNVGMEYLLTFPFPSGTALHIDLVIAKPNN
ncbi:hypothetical protein ACR780_16525 [Sphingobacterium faecium]|uniref:hypothetical protein n=1 Tax=Sphingobacterium faecium TaxID=34087 RepID=UPI003DA4EEBB